MSTGKERRAAAAAAKAATLAACAAVPDIEDLANPRVLKSIRERSVQCGCDKCAAACSCLPGMYDPWQILRMLATNSGVDPAEVDWESIDTLEKLSQLEAKYKIEWTDGKGLVFPGMTIDYKFGDSELTHFYLRPKMADETRGMARFVPQTGACSNLGAHGCKLSRDQMPIGCVAYMGCGPHTQVDKGQSDKVWGTDIGRFILEAFKLSTRRRDPSERLELEDLQKEMENAQRNPINILQMLLAGMKMS